MKDLTVESLYAEIITRVTGERQESEKKEIIVRNHPEFGQIRIVMIEGEPWFIAKDVCDCLGLGNPRTSLALLDDDEKITVHTVDGNPRAGIPHQYALISEPGFYSLVLRSRRPEAKTFKRWVTHDVLPSIRKTGSYGNAPAVSDAQKYLDRVDLNKRTVSKDHFSVFHEIGPMAPELIHAEVPLDEHTMPDISAGRAWSKHWKKNGLDRKFGPRSRYGHIFPSYYPQAKKNPVEAWQYPLDSLPDFRRWLDGYYIPIGFPRYIKGKVKDGTLPETVARKAIEAFASREISQ